MESQNNSFNGSFECFASERGGDDVCIALIVLSVLLAVALCSLSVFIICCARMTWRYRKGRKTRSLSDDHRGRFTYRSE